MHNSPLRVSEEVDKRVQTRIVTSPSKMYPVRGHCLAFKKELFFKMYVSWTDLGYPTMSRRLV